MMHRIASKLTLSIGIVSLVLTAFLVYQAYTLTNRRIKKVVKQETSILERYGNTAGFHRPMNEIIGSDTVAIPMTKISKKLWAESIPIFLIGGLMLLLFSWQFLW